jgi:hypothetical protein
MKKINTTWFQQHSEKFPPILIFLLIAFILLVSLACNAPISSQNDNPTQIAFNNQVTQLALQEDQATTPSDVELDSQENSQLFETQTARAETQIAFDIQSTINAQNASGATNTPLPANIPEATSTPQIPTETPSSNISIEEMIESANILLFENVTKVPLTRHIKRALDNLGLSRNYVDTKDATGNFKVQLLSGTDWDLIVVGVEARSSIQGEFFDYFNEQVNKGTSLILEIWNLDEITGSKASAFLTNCGIKVQSDWYDPPMTSRSIWWLYGEHPIFHEPNQGMSLVNYSPYWSGDAGDLLRTIPGSDAIMLAGLYAQEKNSNGLLATCHDGRVIIQTYSSHDYRSDDVIRLWENYIYNALKAHFKLVIGE